MKYEDIRSSLKNYIMNTYDIKPSLAEKTVEEMFKKGAEFISKGEQKEILEGGNDEGREEYGDIVKETDNQIEYVIAQTYSPVDFCSYGKCPICGETVSGFSIGSSNLCDKECPKCGQKLKWR